MGLGGQVDVVVVADTVIDCLTIALNVIVAKKMCPVARFHVALPYDCVVNNAVAEDVLSQHAETLFRVVPPKFIVDDKVYRGENKINALIEANLKDAILLAPDTALVRTLPIEYLFQGPAKAVPEYNPSNSDLAAVFSKINLEQPTFKVLFGGGATAPPLLNVGFVVCPQTERFARVWHMMCEYVRRSRWLDNHWHSIDRVGLLLAMAQISPQRCLGVENILPGSFHRQIYSWQTDSDLSAARGGFSVRYYDRVDLFERIFQREIAWIQSEYPVITAVLDELRARADRSPR